MSLSHAVQADGGHKVENGRLLASESVTLQAAGRIVLSVNYPATASITLNHGTNNAATVNNVRVTGPLVLPGPAQVVLTNTIVSPEADGAVTYTAALAS